MSGRQRVLCYVCFVLLFLTLNRRSYQGYFQADDLDTLSWAPRLAPTRYLKAALSPRLQENKFRPVGHFFFYVGGSLFGFDFPKWAGLVQAIHLLNVMLLWLVIRQLGAAPVAAMTACLFWGLHMALFDAFWKPMYIFDVLCASFSLLAILFYRCEHWIGSFASFWLAYKAKELAVMLPLVLLASEYYFGAGSWKRRAIHLAPFFLVSLSFGLQAVLTSPHRNDAYTFRLTSHALKKTSAYYAGRVFLVPYLGFAVLLAGVVWRRKLIRFGSTAAVSSGQNFLRLLLCAFSGVGDAGSRDRRNSASGGAGFGIASLGAARSFSFPAAEKRDSRAGCGHPGVGGCSAAGRRICAHTSNGDLCGPDSRLRRMGRTGSDPLRFWRWPGCLFRQ